MTMKEEGEARNRGSIGNKAGENGKDRGSAPQTDDIKGSPLQPHEHNAVSAGVDTDQRDPIGSSSESFHKPAIHSYFQ